MDRRLVFLTLTFLLISVAFIVNKQVTTGFFLDKGVELRGGNLVTISFENANFNQVSALADTIRGESGVAAYPVTTSIGTQLSVEETSNTNTSAIISRVNSTLPIRTYEVSTIDPKLSSGIIVEIMKGILIAFVGMAVVIFLMFRTPIPSLAVVLAAFSDMVMTVFIMNLLGIQMNMATFIALLMLLGYSVDSDILLTSRTLKEKGNFDANYKSAFKTGITMVITSITALTAVILIAGYSSVFGELAAVIIIGLIVDVPNTWIQNAAILSWYKEKYNK
jgi:preprotein translocase subunit SecF